MLEHFAALADEIATIRELGERAGYADLLAVAEQMVDLFTHMLDELAEEEGMLPGEMPWWNEWTKRNTG